MPNNSALIVPADGLASAAPMEWLGRLAAAGTPREAAALIVRLARAEPGCEAATVLWALVPGETAQSEPPSSLDSADRALADSAAAAALPLFSPDGCRVAIPLLQSGPAVLLLRMAPTAGQGLVGAMAPMLYLAGWHLRRAQELADLKIAVAGLERSEQLQRALFAISDLAGSDRDMPDLLKGIHAIVGTLMYARNFFIVRLDAGRERIRFLYFVDVEDAAPAGDMRVSDFEHTLTWYLLHDGRPLRGDTSQLRTQISGPLRIVGTDSYDWLGVPMLRDGVVEGAIVVQSYEPGIVYSADDQALLEFVGSHILTALERKRGQDELERSVQQRTLELADANKILQLEIVERQRGERLQAAQFHIAQMATADTSQSEFYSRLHAEVGELSEYVLRHGNSLRCTLTEVEALARQGEVNLKMSGSPSLCWLGVPLLVADQVIGLVAVQSYDPAVTYAPADQELLGFVASQIANTLHRRRAAESLQQAYAQLEQRVHERTQELREEIGQRERAQMQLKHQVMHDALTGLPNRGYLLDRLNRVLARLKREPARRCALLYLHRLFLAQLPAHLSAEDAEDRPRVRRRTGSGRPEHQLPGGHGDPGPGRSAGHGGHRRRHRDPGATGRAGGHELRIRPGLSARPAGADRTLASVNA